jgi:uncharacterized membrane protein
MPTIEACIDVNVPVQTAYDQWKQFEKFPQVIEVVKEGNRINTHTHPLHWKTEIAGRGVVTFQPILDVMSTVVLQLAYSPGGIVEHLGDGAEASSARIQKELKRFKAFAESCHHVKGTWLNSVPYRAFP